MANLNLSEFTEKLFVTDADHTFIWDTAASISKRVSRNSWLNSGTLTSDAPVTISQTWNAVGQTFKAFVVNAAGTSDANSASGSLLADFQLGGTTKAKIDKLGIITANRIILDQSGSTYQLPANTPVFWTGASFLRSPSAGLFSFENNTQANFFVLAAEAANTLALRNGAAAQTFNVYGTWTTAITNFERLAIKYNTTDVAYQIAAEKGTTNGDYRPLQLWTGGASRLHITTAGNVGIGTTAPGSTLTVAGTFHFGSNNGALIGGTSYGGHLGSTQYFGLRSTSAVSTTIYLQNNSSGDKNAVIRILGSGSGADHGALDINTIESSPILFTTGLSNERMRITAAGNVGIGTTSPTSKLHVAGDITSDTNIYAGTNGYLFINGRSAIGSFIAGGHTLLDNAGSFYNRLNLGGNTNLFPAIKRVGAELQIVIASTTSAAGVAAPDADMAFIEDRYRRKGAGTPEGVVTAPIGAVYHNTTGGAGTSFYVKESGTGNTGWVGK